MNMAERPVLIAPRDQRLLARRRIGLVAESPVGKALVVAMSRRILNAGAFYTYVTHGLGRPAGVGAAFVALAAYNLMQTGLYGGFGVVMGQFMTAEFGVNGPWWVWALYLR